VPAPRRIEDIDDARRLQLLIDGVVDYAIYLISVEGRILSWNSGAKRLKGYEADEILGQPFATFFSPEDRARGIPERALATAAENGRFESEGWRVRKDGTRFWAMGVIDAIYGEDGELIAFAKVTRDMTERRLAEQRLMESERRFQRLVQAVVDYAIFQLDPNGFITTWNTGAQRIKGYTAQEAIGKHFSHFYTPEDRDAGLPKRALESAAANGRYEAEGWRVRKDGRRFWASVVIDPIRDEEGGLVGFAKITRDITERMESQRALRETQERLAAAQKMEAIGQLSGGIAHDFNNLLMIVIGNLETALRRARDMPGGGNVQRFISNAIRGAQRAAALTSRLLAFSRRQPLSPRPLDLNRFLNSAVDFLQRALGERIEVQVVGAAGLWKVEVDPNHLEVALINLAINARDAMPNGGKLTLEAGNVFVDEEYCRRNPGVSPGQFVLLCVSDTGAGMPPEVLQHAFEPFFTTKELGQGTGLGLSQVYGFVKQSGGHIKIYSEVDQGTTVKVYLPRLAGSAEELEQQIEPPKADGQTGETILVVEDDPDVRAYLDEALRDLGYRVIKAANAEQAMKHVRDPHVSIDLLLTDIVMPGKNGRQLATDALQLRPSLPVVFMTGYSRNAVVHQGRVDSGVDLIQKPVTQSELAVRLRSALDRRRPKP
jgi:PAS domain S-box-containing protein